MLVKGGRNEELGGPFISWGNVCLPGRGYPGYYRCWVLTSTGHRTDRGSWCMLCGGRYITDNKKAKTDSLTGRLPGPAEE